MGNTTRASDCRSAAWALASVAATVLTASLICEDASAAPKTDIVEFTNGDTLTGEVKGLQQGILTFKTDMMSTVSIKWEYVRNLKTSQYLEVENTEGSRYYGQVPEFADPEAVRLVYGESVSVLPLGDVVRIAPIEQGDLLARLKGSVSAGFSYTKASDIGTFTFNGDLRSRTRKREWSLDGSSTVTNDSDGGSSERYQLAGYFRYFLANRRFLLSGLSFEANDELGLKLRTSLAGGYGTYLIQDQRHEWSAYGGLAATREKYDSESERDSIEGVLGTSYSFFRFNPLNANVYSSLVIFPSLTEAGRVRSEGKLSSRWEIVKDLYFEISLYGSYDNEPGETATSDYDYGTTTSLGYSF
jgi:putative salt-induced outer membrane protein YdiY